MNNFHKNHKLAIGFAIIFMLMTVLVTGCGPYKVSSETRVVSEITMSTAVDSDNRPVNPTTVFTTDAPAFYCSFKMSGFPIGAKVEAQWIYVGGDPEVEAVYGKNSVVYTQMATIQAEGWGYTYTVYEQPTMPAMPDMPAMPEYKWPKGDYKVVITVDDKEKASTTFKIQ